MKKTVCAAAFFITAFDIYSGHALADPAPAPPVKKPDAGAIEPKAASKGEDRIVTAPFLPDRIIELKVPVGQIYVIQLPPSLMSSISLSKDPKEVIAAEKLGNDGRTWALRPARELKPQPFFIYGTRGGDPIVICFELSSHAATDHEPYELRLTDPEAERQAQVAAWRARHEQDREAQAELARSTANRPGVNTGYTVQGSPAPVAGKPSAVAQGSQR